MKSFVVSAVLFPLVLVGCASSDSNNMPDVSTLNDAVPGTVMLYRTSSLQGTLAKAYVGIDEDYFAELEENQYTQFNVNSGFHNFTAKTHASVHSASSIQVNEGETICIQVRPNHEELEWLAIPFVNAMIPSFVMKETPCPSAKALAEMTSV